MKRILFTLSLALLSLAAVAAGKSYDVASPDGLLTATVQVDSRITFSVSRAGTVLLAPSPLSMELTDGRAFGRDDKVRKATRRQVDNWLDAPVYKKSRVREQYNELTLTFQEFDLVVRAFDAGVAYRFVSRLKGDFFVKNEQADFTFPADNRAVWSYVRDHSDVFETQFFNSFENSYTDAALSTWDPTRMAFLPLVVESPQEVKVLITESDLLNYPGMYLHNPDGGKVLKGVWAPYPKEVKQGGHNMLQGLVQSRENYIAKASGAAAFPWRIVTVAAQDKDLVNNDLTWLLGTPAQGDFSWVKPGKVAWDWWNDWNIYNVDFKAGINNDTYKYYIDFASKNGVEYVILDEGWAVNLKADLMQVIPEIDIPMLSRYAQERGVGLILWAGYWAFDRDMDAVCKYYSNLGIKGFKIDFMDRDDQIVVDFYRRAAETCAKYGLMADFHGAYKPSGLNRTWPNVINYEGVNGLEQMKWSTIQLDQVTYDVTIPFIRMSAGPMDYTQGAMRNATRRNYYPSNSEPMSQGTRCRQLAEYTVFDSPLNMLCDSPSNYLAEPECLRFIAEIPTVWDETVAMDGKIGDYVAVARRKGQTWYVGAMTDWTDRTMDLDLSFLGAGNWKMEVFRDGPNANRAARDFQHVTLDVPADRKVSIHMFPGGGWTARITR